MKSWNLMTRTNGNEKFEFINWHLTFIWLTGGFFRYFLLFPARLTILLIGVREEESYLLSSSDHVLTAVSNVQSVFIMFIIHDNDL